MKLINFTNAVVLGLALTVAVTGCKKRPTDLTMIPNPGRTGAPANPGTAAPINDGQGIPGKGLDKSDTGPTSTPVRPVPDPNDKGGFPQGTHDNWNPNAEILKQYTAYFDFDSSAVKSSEQTKVASVADYLKSHSVVALKVEGHCDERGTEEYNRALGERRALALREELIKLGIDPSRVDTISFGKDKPADPGHSESAWRKNRRGEFIVLTPPTAP